MADSLTAENPNKIESESLAFIFKANRDIFPAKPYNEDGNPEMYTQANKDKRQALRNNPIVLEAIQKFSKEFTWSGPSSNRVVSKEEYFRIFVKVGMILRPGIDSDELTKFIKEDFDNDSQDKSEAEPVDGQPPKLQDYLDEKKLFDGLFELCDTWCQNIDEYEYQGFFKQLEFRMKYSG